MTTNLEKKAGKWTLQITSHLESSQSNNKIEGHIAAALQVNAHQRIIVAKDISVEAGDNGQAKAVITLDISEVIVKIRILLKEPVEIMEVNVKH